MRAGFLYAAALIGSLIAAAACGGSSPSSTPPAIQLVAPREAGPAYIQVSGVSPQQLSALEAAHLSQDQWSNVLRVAVGRDAPPMLGRYAIADGGVRFTPAFPLDAGRQYEVRFDPSTVAASGAAPLTATVGLPASTAVPSTVVSQVYPSGDIVPENLLRMYVEFSAPMGRRSGIDYMTLLDEQGKEIVGAFLPLDYEFWSPDHRRFTAFFDPGRVKSGILPNQQMGRPLRAGTSVTLVISTDWRDDRGLPLTREYRRVLRVGPADNKPLDPATWRIHPPRPDGHDPLVVSFPEPLDRGLLMRALGVRRSGAPVDGAIAVEAGETRWTFTPKDAWKAGAYDLLALDILEDLAGNQIGRAFEVDNFDTVDRSPNPKTVTLRFAIQ